MHTSALGASIKPAAIKRQPKRSSLRSVNSITSRRKTLPAKCPPLLHHFQSRVCSTEAFVRISYYVRVPLIMRNLRALFAFASLLTLVIFAPRDLRAQARRGVTPEDYFSFK